MPERFSSFEEAKKSSKKRFSLPLDTWTKRSVLLREIKQQKRLFEF
jgi:hypothetical protein